MQLEKIWYEASPFIYTVTGGYFLGMSESGILSLSSLILISAGGTITAMRRRYEDGGAAAAPPEPGALTGAACAARKDAGAASAMRGESPWRRFVEPISTARSTPAS